MLMQYLIDSGNKGSHAILADQDSWNPTVGSGEDRDLKDFAGDWPPTVDGVVLAVPVNIEGGLTMSMNTEGNLSGKCLEIQVSDTLGGGSCDGQTMKKELRPSSAQKTREGGLVRLRSGDVVMLCFPLVSPNLAECLEKGLVESGWPDTATFRPPDDQDPGGWLYYIQVLAPTARIVLVGTRWDMRSEDSQAQRCQRAEDMRALVARLRGAGNLTVMSCVEATRPRLAEVFDAAAWLCEHCVPNG